MDGGNCRHEHDLPNEPCTGGSSNRRRQELNSALPYGDPFSESQIPHREVVSHRIILMPDSSPDSGRLVGEAAITAAARLKRKAAMAFKNNSEASTPSFQSARLRISLPRINAATKQKPYAETNQVGVSSLDNITACPTFEVPRTIEACRKRKADVAFIKDLGTIASPLTLRSVHSCTWAGQPSSMQPNVCRNAQAQHLVQHPHRECETLRGCLMKNNRHQRSMVP